MTEDYGQRIMMLDVLLFLFLCLWASILPKIAQYLVQDHIPFNLLFFSTNIAFFLFLPLNNTLQLLISFYFFSCLWITIYTDFYHMLISRFVSWYLIPGTIIAGHLSLLPITFHESLLGTAFGFTMLWLTNKIFYYFKKCDGLGQGDLELLAFIGSVTGPFGVWTSLQLGSILGSLFIIAYKIWTKKTLQIISFGVFLSLGAMLHVLLTIS